MGETGGTPLPPMPSVVYLPQLTDGQAAVTALGHQRAAMDNSTLLVPEQVLEGPLVAVLCWRVRWNLALPLTVELVIFWKAAQWRKCFGLPGFWSLKEGGKAFVGQCLCKCLCRRYLLAEEESSREGKQLVQGHTALLNRGCDSFLPPHFGRFSFHS